MIVRCSNAPCERHARIIGGAGPWTCEPCEQGEKPLVQRATAAGVKAKGKR